MICDLPLELEQSLAMRAAERCTTPEQLVVEAVTTYLMRGEPTHPASPGGEDALRLFHELQKAASVSPQIAVEWKNTIHDGRR